LEQAGVKALYIEPGSPWQNGYAESFHSRLRSELLDAEVFETVGVAQALAAAWRNKYNHHRPHSSLGYQTPAAFASGNVGVAWTSNETLSVAGGTTLTPSYTWTVVGPSWIGLTNSTGPSTQLEVIGTPPNTGPVAVTVRLENAFVAANPNAVEFVERTFNVVVTAGTLTITGPATLPNGTEGTPYGPATAAATDGIMPYTWSAIGLPTGVSINPGTGEISGTPTVTGPFNIVVTVTDSDTPPATDDQNYSITIDPAIPPINIVTTTLGIGVVGSAYTETVTLTGGAAPFTWSISAGTLPPGLALAGSTTDTETISGNPTAAGTFNFTVEVTDGNSTDSQALSIVIDPLPIIINTNTLPDGTRGAAYSQNVVSVHGTAPFLWTIVSATPLPPGLSLNGSITNTVAIEGTPSQSGTFSFTIQVEDSLAATDTQILSITIADPPGPSKPSGSNGSGSSCALSTGSTGAMALFGLLAIASLRRRRRSAS
jgi:MYXO-CTERM domain-containing protein